MARPKGLDTEKRRKVQASSSKVEALFPNLVINAGLPDTVARGLEYDGFIPILVKVVQEQERRIAVLERENAALRARLSELEGLQARVSALEGRISQESFSKRP